MVSSKGKRWVTTPQGRGNLGEGGDSPGGSIDPAARRLAID
jgi:hypothetical protein